MDSEKTTLVFLQHSNEYALNLFWALMGLLSYINFINVLSDGRGRGCL